MDRLEKRAGMVIVNSESDCVTWFVEIRCSVSQLTSVSFVTHPMKLLAAADPWPGAGDVRERKLSRWSPSHKTPLSAFSNAM